ncbi:outer membrane protein [Histoplasma capsulatum G186AR]|uniref:Outer membrane protein n=2 Tax=Ajellomyces capsulatus TaxID=5037 RepID=C0NYS6_AJECG|nr:outer membrane protein [Histoplasma capsulatum G186AR]EEH03366.1 outer membrane protein [Histoplasma capsulatum G186AR]KAG5295777.1 outer membrane protein [Histoplasma capsulatum]QSS73758.1 outer membrane protein [Histoplasma capsulatum G186AR]
MGSPLASDENIFELLQQQSADPKLLEEQQQAVNERINTIYQKAQARLAELIDQNSTLPCTISSVQVLNANNTRRGFLERVLSPLLSSNNHRPYTLSEALKEISVCTDTLSRFDIFEHPISVFLDKPSQADPSTSPTDLEVYLSVKEKSRILLKTGTDLGNAEGSAYTNFMWRNIFGGAESLNINASLGTRTKSAYQATFETPILSNPDVRCEFGGIGSSTEKSWASHEEAVKGGWAKLRWLSAHGHRHELGYNGFWRQVTGLSTNASPTVRGDAGDSVKSSICHTWINDQRDNPFLPSQGFYMRTFNEMAGWGPLKGDVSFWKSEVEAQGAIPIPIPGVKGNTGFSLTTGARAGVLCPLGLDTARKPQLSRINDRFQLGGPTDVRGFRLSGIGPREGPDALGGDVFAACSANLLCPLPRVGAEKPLRLQAFVNCGRLLSLKTQNGKLPSTQGEVIDSILATVSELKNGLPSMAAGLGLVYAHPAARCELNVSLPLVTRKGEEGRKGLQLGIGINFL